MTVVDAAHEGRATAAGAGIVQPWGSALEGPLYDLYAAGAAHYPGLVGELAECGIDDVGYRRAGCLIVDPDPRVLDEIEHRVRVRTADVPIAGPIERVDPTTARELFPPLADDLAGLHLAGGARVDGRKLCRGLLAAIVAAGGRLVDGPAELVLAEDHLTVTVKGERLEGDAVVVAGGAWTTPLLEPLSMRVAVEPQRGQIVHLRVDGADTGRWPAVTPLADHYLVTFDDQRVVVGATRETGSGFDPRVTVSGVRHVLDRALSVAPGLAEATVIETRVGLRPLPSNGRPTIGQVPGVRDLYVATGYGAIGLTIGPLVGERLAATILDGTADPSLAAFTPT